MSQLPPFPPSASSSSGNLPAPPDNASEANARHAPDPALDEPRHSKRPRLRERERSGVEHEIGGVLAEMAHHPHPPPLHPPPSFQPFSPPSTTSSSAASTSALPVPPSQPTLSTPSTADSLTASPSTAVGKEKQPQIKAKAGGGKGKGQGRGRGKSDQRLAMSEEAWKESRRVNHKEVERLRRQALTSAISLLSSAVPPSFSPSSSASCSRDAASSAGGTAQPPPLQPPQHDPERDPNVSHNAEPEPAAHRDQDLDASGVGGIGGGGGGGGGGKADVLLRALGYIKYLEGENARLVERLALERLLRS